MSQRAHRRARTLLGSLSFGVCLACGTDGETPSCGDYPQPYDIRVAIARDLALEQLVEPAERGCVTLPAGYASSKGGAGGSTPNDPGGTAGEPADPLAGTGGLSSSDVAGAAGAAL